MKWNSTATILAMAGIMLAAAHSVRADETHRTDDAKQEQFDAVAVKSLSAPSFVVPKTGGIRMLLIKPGTFTMGRPPWR
jgi:hypothetical protein